MPLAQGQPIRAAHINELRDRIRALQGGASERWFYHLDALGSVRVVTGPTGGLIRRHEYGPFGDDLAPWSGADPRRFTGKERDPETGLDYFSARYYGATIGRFTTVDPHNIVSEAEDEADLVAYLSAPQRWNRYAYSLNNPGKFKDPDGRNPVLIGAAIGAISFGGWQAIQNLINDRPILEGVAGEVAKGLLAGGTLGIAGPVVAGVALDSSAGIPLGLAATQAGGQGARFDWSRAGHVFRDAVGHVDPTTPASRERFARLFEAVASDVKNFRPDFLLPSEARASGVKAFTKIYRDGQIWVYLRDGKIVDAGVNSPGTYR